jgi:ATP-dependent helicase HrpA
VLNDLKEQLDHLAPPGFLGAVPYEWLRHYPRYLAAIQRRVGKLVGDGLTKDLRKIAEFQAYWRGYVELSQKSEEGRRFDAALHQYRWMLEEYRVSLFAQELRTSITVSPKRLEEQWALLSPKAPSA